MVNARKIASVLISNLPFADNKYCVSNIMIFDFAFATKAHFSLTPQRDFFLQMCANIIDCVTFDRNRHFAMRTIGDHYLLDPPNDIQTNKLVNNRYH